MWRDPIFYERVLSRQYDITLTLKIIYLKQICEQAHYGATNMYFTMGKWDRKLELSNNFHCLSQNGILKKCPDV